MLLLKDLPKYETLLAYSKRYRNVNPDALEAYFNLLRVASDVLDGLERYYAKNGTSQGRFTVLALLNREPDKPLCPAELAERSGVTRATMTGLLQGLETDGLIKRTMCTADKRMCYVALTNKGRKYLDSVLPDLFRRLGQLMDGVNEKESKNLVKLLEKVRGRIPALMATDGEPAVNP
ncbi:MAG TPA: MarR family transcriptional regulator, partial [Verrucomicrobiae bacterium]|nr:MarR family transcriptional regulator [Verrucomicrobiae bacterium]